MKLLGFLPVSRRAMELFKARNLKLVQRPIIVHGPTGNYTRNAWILPEEAASERPRAAQFDLFDTGQEPVAVAEKPTADNMQAAGEYLSKNGYFGEDRVNHGKISGLVDKLERAGVLSADMQRKLIEMEARAWVDSRYSSDKDIEEGKKQLDSVRQGKIDRSFLTTAISDGLFVMGGYVPKRDIDPANMEIARVVADAIMSMKEGKKDAGLKPVKESAEHGEYEKRDEAFREALREQSKRSNKQIFGYDPDEEAAEHKYQSTKNTLDAEYKRIQRYDEILKEHAAEKKSGNSGYSVKDRNYYKEKADEAKESMRWYRKNWPDQYARWSSETGFDPISSTGKLSAKAAKDSSRWEKMKGAGEFALKFPDPESGSDMVYGRVYRFDHFNGRPPTYYTSDEKIFETLAEAKKHEWETHSLPDLIRDGYVEAEDKVLEDVGILQQELSILKEGKLPDGDTLRKHGFPAPFVEYGGMDVSDISRALTILGYSDSSKKAIIKKMGRPSGTMSDLRDAIVGYESEKAKKSSAKKASDETIATARKMASENEDIAYAVALYDTYDRDLKQAKADRAEGLKMREYDSQRSMLGGLSRNNIRLQAARARVANSEANKARMVKEIDQLVKKNKTYR